MTRFKTFMKNASKIQYAVRYDSKVTTRQLLTQKISEIDKSSVIDNKISDNIFWVTTTLPKTELADLVGVEYVIESTPT